MPLPPAPRTVGLRAATAIAALEALALIAYTVFLLVEALRLGTTGPEEVSNVPALVTEIVVFAAFGAGLAWLTRGLWLRRAWARTPFLVAQIFGLVVGIPLLQAEGGVERAVGAAVVACALVGAVLVFTPAVSAELNGDDPTA